MFLSDFASMQLGRQEQTVNIERVSLVVPMRRPQAPPHLPGLGEVILTLPEGLTNLSSWRGVEGPAGRGAQLATGAAAARGDWLLFLHADTRLGPGWEAALLAAMRDPGRAGYFRLALDDAAPAARRLERAVAWRCRVLALPYGDQGLFISRALYDAVGGFRPLPLMEDVELVRRLGRRRLRPLDAEAITSAERFRREGYLRRSARNLSILALWHLGVGEARLARLYDRRAK